MSCKISTDINGFKDLVYIGEETLGPGEIVYKLTGDILDKPTRTSIQIGPNKHIEDDLGQYINHSCSPTVKIMDDNVVVIEKLYTGDSITFDYNESEDIMSNPFKCNCCSNMIKGKNA